MDYYDTAMARCKRLGQWRWTTNTGWDSTPISRRYDSSLEPGPDYGRLLLLLANAHGSCSHPVTVYDIFIQFTHARRCASGETRCAAESTRQQCGIGQLPDTTKTKSKKRPAHKTPVSVSPIAKQPQQVQEQVNNVQVEIDGGVDVVIGRQLQLLAVHHQLHASQKQKPDMDAGQVTRVET